MDTKTGGPAFPHEYKYGDGTAHREDGMSLRDYFAANCPHEEVEDRIPKTCGDLADIFVALGWVSMERRNRSVINCYTERHVQRLRALVRYEYADDMLTARGARHD